jgi:hypothetical protein
LSEEESLKALSEELINKEGEKRKVGNEKASKKNMKARRGERYDSSCVEGKKRGGKDGREWYTISPYTYFYSQNLASDYKLGISWATND